MPLSNDLVRRGQHVMTVCNACRYCEAYCPVFPAMERRPLFEKGDLAYLANLCHNCGECLYACQYAPPHEFGINVPRTLAEIRLASYEDYCWPRPLSRAFRRHGLLTALTLLGACIGLVVGMSWMFGRLAAVDRAADFYQVMPHETMVSLFGAVALFVVIALAVARARFAAEIRLMEPGIGSPQTAIAADRRSTWHAYRDALTLRHLHATGADCATALETRRPWRRWFHHLTLGGFLLCAASTSVAAIYHLVFGWRAPYPLDSVPVLLGAAGGVGLLIGPAGSLAIRFRRDEELSDGAQNGLDVSFIALLWLTSATGLVLLVAREHSMMPALLMVHLGSVLALFLTLPYGKFVHGIYRIVALVKYASDETH